MQKRKIIKIDESKCNGCGLCANACAEGAIEVVDGKAKLIKESHCDGLGACIGECPEGAITIEEREAYAFNEAEVQQYLSQKSKSASSVASSWIQCNCPSLVGRNFGTHDNSDATREDNNIHVSSQLRQWPIQLKLVSPQASYLKNADVLLCADCVPFAYANFHADLLKGKKLVIACPKLDTEKEMHVSKLVSMINDSEIKSLTVAIMEVPCCAGLKMIAGKSIALSNRKIEMQSVVIGITGEKLN